jgi:microcin C transport system substrate-binding protein
MVVNAPDRQELIYRTRALDRVLLWHFYVIPQWHINSHRIAFWDRFGRPAVNPKYGLPVETTWWFDEAKARAIVSKQTAGQE